MMWEVEQKSPAADVAAVREKLVALGAAFGEPIGQADLYLAHPSRDFSQTDEAFRLRQVGEQNFMTYKGPRIDSQTKTRQEIELPIAPGAQALRDFTALLTALGFRPVATVRKTRQPAELCWEGSAVHIALDQVKGLGSFVELEIQAEENELDRAREAIASLAGRLGLTNFERRSYLELLLENLV